jgi:hypothetical protein
MDGCGHGAVFAVLSWQIAFGKIMGMVGQSGRAVEGNMKHFGRQWMSGCHCRLPALLHSSLRDMQSAIE